MKRPQATKAQPIETDILNSDVRINAQDAAKRELLMADLKNRFSYHPPFGSQVERYQAIRDILLSASEFLLVTCPESVERTQALSRLEEACFYANAAIARNEKP